MIRITTYVKRKGSRHYRKCDAHTYGAGTFGDAVRSVLGAREGSVKDGWGKPRLGSACAVYDRRDDLGKGARVMTRIEEVRSPRKKGK